MMRQVSRRAGLSFGDRACLALALIHGLPVLTADRAWAKVDVGVEVRLIR
jgi:PIN domain nuclease of toxin-antitoxin system